MGINGISYNPYIYTGAKAAINSYGNSSDYVTYPQNSTGDKFASTDAQGAQATTSSEELRAQLSETKSKNGFIGGIWDGFKNLTGIGAGSNKAEKAIESFEKGEITQEEAAQAVEKYKQGQKQCVDMVADIASGIAAFAAFSFATGVGLAAAPFTGGASLGLVAAGFGVAFGAGAVTKVAVKGIDAAAGGREYGGKDLLYDVATGGINGMFAPITAGIGGAAGKAVAGRVGVSAVREGGEIIVKEGLKGTAKGALTKTLLTTSVKYTGGNIGTRALCLGVDMAVNGAITGAVDSSVRYVAGDEENKSLEGLLQNAGQGAIGGFIAAPVIGGGMRLAGNGIGKITNKLANKVDVNYAQAKSAFMNTPVVDNPDMEIIQGLSGVVKSAQDIVGDVKVRGTDFFSGADRSLYDISEGFNTIASNTRALNSELGSISADNRVIINEILGDIAQGKDVSSRVADLAQKGISITDMIDTKLGGVTSDIESKLVKIMSVSEDLTLKTSNILDFAGEKLNATTELIEEGITYAQRIPDSKAYQQLGEFPQRAKSVYTTLKTDASALDEVSRAAREKMMTGQVQEGLTDLNRYYTELDAFNLKVEQQMSQVESSASRAGITDYANAINERLSRRMNTPEFMALSREAQVQAVIEDSNIAFSKFIQTFSSDESLPDATRKMFKNFISNGTASRNLGQAQTFADELYGQGKYTLVKSFGAGTIGETYLAKDANGTEFVIKMLKEGVTPEKFAQDRAIFTKYISEYVTDPVEREYKSSLINGMFDSWDRELNFGFEAQGAKEMAVGAKRFDVAQTLEIGSTGGQNVSLVMQKADGVELNTLIDMMKFKKQNPADFLTKSVKDVDGSELNPWIKKAEFVRSNPQLASSNDWMLDVQRAYQSVQNEQAMFVSKSGIKTVHADPHSGNVFMDFDPKTGKPKVTYIDTGNVVQRTNSEVIKDVGLSLNTMIGNTRGIANSMLDGATLPSGANRAEITEKLVQLLDERLFKAGVNLKNVGYTQNTINGIMKELNIIPNASNSNLMKATLQRIQTSREIAAATGVPMSKSVDIQDLGSALLKSFKTNPKETWQTIKPIMQWAYKNNDQAMITFFQMLMKKAK